jgi:serine/threonine protein kinase
MGNWRTETRNFLLETCGAQGLQDLVSSTELGSIELSGGLGPYPVPTEMAERIMEVVVVTGRFNDFVTTFQRHHPHASAEAQPIFKRWRRGAEVVSEGDGSSLGQRFKLIKELGRGAMGRVYEAFDTRLERHVAIKILRRIRALDSAYQERFQREARTLASLDHPNIVKVFNAGEIEERYVIEMELVSGHTLAEHIPPGGLPFPEVIRLAVDLARALLAAHQINLIHRDLKPSNLMVADDGRLIVLDFGLAKEPKHPDPNSNSQITTQTYIEESFAGTLPYMSPEQLRRQPLDSKTDIWSMGVVLYEMVTGNRPFPGAHYELMSAILHDPPQPIDTGSSPPEELRELIGRCLDKDPRRRPLAGDALSDLEALADHQKPT